MALVVAAFAAGCGGSGSSGSGGSGTLRVYMADAPGDPTVSSLKVTIDRVDAHVGSQWQTITTTQQTIDLLTLVKDDMLLCQGQLPAGQYTQVRLFVSKAEVTDSTGTYQVTIPSNLQTGIKLNLDYDVSANDVTAILLDFNVSKSLIREGNGQYRLQPVIPAAVKILSGTITGKVTDGSGNALEGAAVTLTGTTYGTTTIADGTFKLWAVMPGTYAIDVTWTDPANTSRVLTAHKDAVVVTANANTDVGTLVAAETPPPAP